VLRMKVELSTVLITGWLALAPLSFGADTDLAGGLKGDANRGKLKATLKACGILK